ncbi:phage tail protein [Paenarthrobacter sp. PH39-S1]|uniref:phage tail protein n=1 Tax=Paenarthrobacter sp. PH39-S1 TaxID=3046204 RepID=UPI0024BB9C38|nr:phage tail protein [Paenarthrobacter sp. PH39-S1]MDJ0355287.1 phage tail protein [Paenarthrobacter sp. PH39-S1]
MYGDRSLSLLVQPDQWSRCAHTNTALLPGGGVLLDWKEAPRQSKDYCPPAVPATRGGPSDCRQSERVPAGPAACEPAAAGPEASEPAAAEPAGLAFDRWCRAYRSWPAKGKVDIYDPDRAPEPSVGAGVLGHPAGLAVDRAQRLYVAEPATRSVLVVDLWAQRLLRRVPLGRGRPVDVAPDCGRVAVLQHRPDALVFLDGRRSPRPGPALINPHCRPGLLPDRLAAGPLVLWRGGGYGVITSPDGTVQLEVDGAVDIATTSDGLLVVARMPGQPFLRFQHDDDGWLELEPASAPDFDGGAVAVSPAGRIVFTTAAGFASTAGSAARHEPEGTVVTYRLDSGRYRTRWGRVFLDACLPVGTDVTLRFVTSDAEDVLDPLDATPPGRGARTVPHPGLTPPLPSQSLLTAVEQDATLFRRPMGREQPWQQISPEDGFETYESQVNAAPGRYLWLRMHLTGTAQTSPRIRAVQIERPGHQLLSSLPRAWSRDDGDADFLHRFLAPLEGTLYELDWRAAERAILLDPRTTPQEALPWLAGFAGLVLDRRWPEPARRTLIAEAYRLFARRGTRAALIRILELYLGRAPVIIEAWQLRGLGGMVLGNPPAGPAPPAVGGNARATGTLGRFSIGGSAPAASTGPAASAGSAASATSAAPSITSAGTVSSSSAPAAPQDSFQLAAHRFTLLIPGDLTPEQRQVVRGIVDVHRPAHTMYELCVLGAGMRVGQRLHVSLTSFVGPDAGWGPAVLGRFRVGGDGVVGTPAPGSRLGETSVAGQVRVG